MIYRSRASVPGSIVNTHEQDAFEQRVAPQDFNDFGLAKDPFLTLPNEQCKEVLVVVKRGRDANIMEESSKPPYDQRYDIRALGTDMSWFEIRENYTEGAGNDEDEYLFGGWGRPSPRARSDTYGCNAYELDWADNEDPEIAAGGGQSQDWNEHRAADLLRSRFVGI